MTDTEVAGTPARTPLYGHVSPETAYLVADYPYGRKVRCRIRYWIERDEKRGYRFCSQTEHPTRLVWNAPKKSTYAFLAGCMYLDEKGHVHWDGLSEYSTGAEVRRFVDAFPGAPLDAVSVWIRMRRYQQRKALALYDRGEAKEGRTQAEIDAVRAEVAAWDAWDTPAHE